MKKVSLLLLIIVSLLATSFAGIGVPRAEAATVWWQLHQRPSTLSRLSI